MNHVYLKVAAHDKIQQLQHEGITSQAARKTRGGHGNPVKMLARILARLIPQHKPGVEEPSPAKPVAASR